MSDSADAANALLVLGGMVFAVAILLMAVNRPTPFGGSVGLYYCRMLLAGFGGMAVTAGPVGFVLQLAMRRGDERPPGAGHP